MTGKHLFYFFILTLVIFSCRPKPTFNPFDNQFYFDRTELTKKGMDTIRDTCGYYEITYPDSIFSVDYYFYYDDIIGKGFSYTIDTINLKKELEFEQYDSLNCLSFNFKKLNLSLKKFNYSVFKQEKNIVTLVSSTKKDTLRGEINTRYREFKGVRTLYYAKENK